MQLKMSCIVENVEEKVSKNDNKYIVLTLVQNEIKQYMKVMVRNPFLFLEDEACVPDVKELEVLQGVSVVVDLEYSPQFRSFVLVGIR